ncbi:ESPR-type extended signal peptide-containing protein [Dialister succinatiphilus]|uniref:ESPR-type extended signal peptide-containing protein n=1 Tax=Dialister succinatiphilus TaxID=487173 RepID=UPI004027C8E4
MNKIFKVIFSKAKGCYVVVSELAKSAGKGTSASHIQRGYRLTLAAAVLSMMMGMAPVGAAGPVDLGNNAAAAYDGKGNLTIGDAKTVAEGKNQKGQYNTTIGTQTDTLRNVKGDTEKKGQPLDGSNTILVDGEGKAHPLDLSTEAGGSTAVGYKNKAEGDNSTAIGNNAKITNKPVTYYVDADGKKTASPENAVWYKDSSGNPTKVPQVFRNADGNTTATPQYRHTYTEKDPDTKEDVTKTEITSDATKADKDSAGNPVYNYKKADNTDKLYSVTLYQAASNSIAAGTDVTAKGSNAVAVGNSSTADNSAVAIGDTASAKENAVAMGKETKATAEGSIALGKGSEASREGGTFGWDPKTGTASTKSDVAWQSGEGALSIGNGGASRQITNVAAGSEDSDAVNLAQLKNAMTHYYSVKTTSDTDAAGGNNYLNDGATGNNALAAGVSAVATGDNATAVGTNTYASGTNASAYGYRAVASGSGSVAIGSGTSAQQEGSVAIGGHTQGSHAVQVGTDSTAQSAYSVAVGGHAKGEYSVEVGYGSTAQGSYSTSIGGHAIGKNSIAIGRDSNPASAGGDNSIAIGGHTNSTNDIAIGAGSSTSGGQAIAVGGSATGGQAVSIGGVAGSFQATAVGSGSAATGSQSTAVGGHAGNVYSTAVGQGANATYAYTTAVGNNSTASGDHSTALGYGTSAQGSNTTAIGGANANGTNLTVIGNNSTASASDYWDNISNSTAVGGAHISASDAAAIGSNATVNGQYGVALGHNSNVSYASTGVGEGTKASNTGTAVGYGSQSSGYQSAAVGAGSQATGQNAVSLGGGGAWGDYSIALGSGAGTTAHGIAIGQNSGAWGENAIAIGEGTNAWRANSIVLGKNSKSGADKNIEGYDPRTGVASVDDTSTWYSTDEAVSIGRAEERDDEGNITASAITRQLNNLAAGTLDTDAVNVAQLKAATQKVNMHDYSVWSPDTETDTNYTNGGAVAKNSMAAGVSASTTKNAENAVAIGYGAQAEGYGATVIGQYGEATGRYALAFGGQQTDTTAKQADNVASGDNALSFGERTTASGTNSTAFGWQTTAKEKRATAFGERTTASGANATAFGQLATASGQNSVAFGNEAVANNYGSTAFGNRTEALGEYSTAFGNSTVAAGMNTAAFGTDNVAGAVLDENGAYTNIIYRTNPNNGRVVKDTNGNPIEISREKMDARGNLAYTDNNGSTKSVTYTVSGGETHSYVLLQGEDGNTYIRDYRGNIRSAVIGDDGTVTVGDKPLTGVNLKQATAGANGYHILSNANATVWGENSIASGEASTAFGVSSIAAAQNSLAALGGTVAASATNAAAIGNGAQAKLADSVALGSGALANRSGGSKGYDVLTGNATTETSAAWVANANAIAIGNDTEGSLLTRQITGVAAGSLDTDAVNVAQLKAAGLGFTTNTKDASNTTDNYKGYKVVSRKLGGTIAIKASDETDNHGYSTKNLTTRIAENGDISILMDENPAFTSVTTSDVIFAGNPDLTDKDGKAAKADTNVHYGAKTLTDSQNITTSGNDPAATRLHYKDEQGHTYELATMDDGQIYAGDIKTDGTPDTTGFGRKMNEKTTINGGVTDKDKLTDKNIGVVSNGADTLTVKLAKDLKDLNSVTTGKTVMDDSGIKITNNAVDETKNVVINGDKISYGGNQVTNMGSGSDGKADGKPTYNTDTNGANIGDVKNIASSTVQPVIDTVNKGWELDVNGKKQKAVTPDSPKVNLIQGQNITIVGDATNTDNVTIATANDVRFNTVRVGGSKTGDTYTGGIVIGKQSGGDSANPDENDYITGLKNTNWDSNKIQSGRAATEDQLKKVADDIKQGTVAGDVYVTGGEVAYHTDGGSDNGQPTVNDGTGKLILTENNKTSNIEITGLHDYYVTNGTITDDGKTLELTRNDRDENENPKKISIDLGNVLKHDLHLVQNPEADSNGKYTVDTKTGTVTLKVLNPNDGSGYSDITIGGFEGLGKGFNFGANQTVAEGGNNPVTNQLGSTINITGAGDKALDKYSGKNLLTSVEQDADGNTNIHVLMDRNISADGVTVGQAGTDGVKGKDGEVGQAGTIGINGKNGVKGDGGKEGITTTIIRTEKGQRGKDGVNGKPGVDGTDITRIVYQNSQDSQDGTDGKDTHTVATLDDGLKFAGDDGQNDASKVITKKLNERLDIVGKAQGDLTDANIGVTKDGDGQLYVRLAKHVDLDKEGALKAGEATIGAFSNTDLTTNKNNHPVGGSYATGLSNTDWNVSDPEYVSGRAATEDQLAKVSEAINNAATAAGKRTVVTVNDKSNPATADPGANAYGEYNTQNGNLMIAAMRDSDGAMTYNIKLNDQLAIGQKGEPGVAGKDGKDGKVTVETKGGTTVVIGHDGEPGKDGKDGLFVTGKDGADGKSGVSITGPNGAAGTAGIDGKVGIAGKDGNDAVSISGKNGIGHIGLTGQKGEDGKDGVFTDLSTTLGTATLDPAKNEQSKSADKVDADDKSSRIQYQTTVTDKDGKTKTVITHEVATMDDGQKYAGDFGDGASVKLNKTVTIKGNVAAGKTKDDFVDGNIAVVANKSQNGEDGELLIKLNKDLTGLNSATYTTSTKNGDVTTTSTTVVDGTGLKIENGPSITNTGIDGGKHQITNVASGKDGKMYDTAVEGHRNWNNAANIGDVTNIAKSAADGVQAKSGKNITVDDNNKINLNDHITLGDAANKAKQVDIDGNGAKITAGDGDNKVTVDGSKGQIIAGGDNGVKIGNIAGGDNSLTIYDKDGNATNQTDKAGKYVTNLGNKTWNKDGSYVSGRAATEDQLHQLESNFNTKVNAVEQNHTAVTVNGSVEAPDAGANGTLGNYTDEKKGNLLLAQKKDSTGKITYDLKLNDKVTLGKAGTNGKDGVDGSIGLKGADGQSSIGLNGKDGISVIGADGKNGVSITGSNGLDGKNGIDGKIAIGTPGKDGQSGKDAVSISGKDGVGHIGLTGPKGADGKDGTNIDIFTVLGKGTLDRNQNEVKGEDKDGTKDQAARIQYQTTVKEADGTTKTITHEVATMDDGMKYGDDFGNTAKVKLNHQLDIVGDINAGKKDGDKKATKDDLSDGNIGIVATDTVYNDDGTVKENGKMTVKLAKDLKGLNSIESNSVTTGNTTINNGGLTIKTGDANRTITMQDGNVNMGGNQIHHVAPGQAPDDAVNVSQLNATNYAVNKLDTRVNRVGANAAALAALHPLDFDPDDKWDFSAGYGHYKDANAAAVGAFYRPNEDTMFSVGGSFGGGENMVNAGVSVKLGQGNHVSTSRVAMAKEIKDLKKDVAALKAVVNQQSALIDRLTGVNAGELSGSDDLFPDVPANHWAYEYVTRLKQAGILTGYPDGNFAGDRMMTRYEFAAIVYRAIMAGAAANPSLNKDGTLDRLAREFSGEMKYIRIDTIRKDRNGRPTIQRVRVIKEDEKEK